MTVSFLQRNSSIISNRLNAFCHSPALPHAAMAALKVWLSGFMSFSNMRLKTSSASVWHWLRSKAVSMALNSLVSLLTGSQLSPLGGSIVSHLDFVVVVEENGGGGNNPVIGSSPLQAPLLSSSLLLITPSFLFFAYLIVLIVFFAYAFSNASPPSFSISSNSLCAKFSCLASPNWEITIE